MKQIIVILSSIIIFSCATTQAQHTKVLDQNSYAQSIQNEKVILIDVRTPEEFANGHLPNAKNMNVSSESFAKDIQSLDKHQPIYIYCQSGKRSAKASAQMEALGFTQIIDLKDGYRAWTGTVVK